MEREGERREREREKSTYPNDRGTMEVAREELDVDGGRHKHQFEVSPSLQKTSQHSHEEVSMDMTLMNLVNN